MPASNALKLRPSYTAVAPQQGRVPLDTDVDEQNALAQHSLPQDHAVVVDPQATPLGHKPPH